jgi:hypothetical protein
LYSYNGKSVVDVASDQSVCKSEDVRRCRGDDDDKLVDDSSSNDTDDFSSSITTGPDDGDGNIVVRHC